jgi:hypothetical protein
MFFLGRVARWWANRHRNIFHYYDGTRTVRADPMVVGARLEAECPNYYELLLILKQDVGTAPVGPVRRELLEQKKEAAEKLAKSAMKVFRLKPLDQEGGVTQGEAMRVLTKYFVFMEELATAAEVFLN